MLLGLTAGEQAAWERFVRRYSGVIYSKCRTYELSPEDSADVLQDVFRKVHLGITDFQRDGSGKEFRRWLRTVAQNVIMDHFRERAKHADAIDAASLLDELQKLEPFCEPDDQKISSEFGDSSVQAFSAKVKQALFTVRLDYEERTWKAFWRTTVDEQRSVDIAEELGMTAKNVRQAKYKILRHLRRELD